MMATQDAATLEIERIHKTYRSRQGDIEALREFSLRVRPNEFVSLVGPSGCGKSTLLKMVAGVTSISGGTVALSGARIHGPASGLSMVFQTPLLLEWRDVLRNVMLPIEILKLDRHDGERRAHELIRMVGLDGFERRYPYELSGGMQQRVSICRALVFDPALLLMDEPFGALDALTRDEMAVELLRIHDETKKTVLFVTHSIDEAVFLSDRVVVMTPRPGTIRLVVPIDLPRPRQVEVRFDPRFVDYSHRIRDAIYSARAAPASRAREGT